MLPIFETISTTTLLIESLLSSIKIQFNSNQIQSNQIKSNRIKSNQIELSLAKSNTKHKYKSIRSISTKSYHQTFNALSRLTPKLFEVVQQDLMSVIHVVNRSQYLWWGRWVSVNREETREERDERVKEDLGFVGAVLVETHVFYANLFHSNDG